MTLSRAQELVTAPVLSVDMPTKSAFKAKSCVNGQDIDCGYCVAHGIKRERSDKEGGAVKTDPK